MYRRARSPAEAVALLNEHDGANILAGGQSLMPMVNMRLVDPTMLVDIGRLTELDYVRTSDRGLEIGAMARHRKLETSPVVKQHCALLSKAAGHIGHIHVRNRGTLGGSLSHADPAAELPVIALALDAVIQARGSNGVREIRASDFFRDMFTTALQSGEIVEQVRFPGLPAASRWAFVEQVQRHGDFALVAVAALLQIDGRTITKATIALGSVAATPIRAKQAEAALVGQSASAEVFHAAAQTAASEVNPPAIIHASADYRREMVAVYTRRALQAAANGTGAQVQ
jgi:carbon-monoxide dehydrogenase medium subunit